MKQQWLPFKHAACDKIQSFGTTPQTVEEESTNSGSASPDSEHENNRVTSPINHQPETMCAPPLCFEMHRDSYKLGLQHIAVLSQLVIVMSPLNAHSERQVKAYVNNLFKVATGSCTGEKYNPQEAIDHWMDLSVQAPQGKGKKIILQCGQHVPIIFHLKSSYKPRTGATKAQVDNSESTFVGVRKAEVHPENSPLVDCTPQSMLFEMHKTPEESYDITNEERAIIMAQTKEDELSHTPNEGAPIRVDIVSAHEDFMANFRPIVNSCFGSNIGLVNMLLNGSTEKNIAGLSFQRSDLFRMLSAKMYRDNSLDMHSKVMGQRCSIGNVPKQVFFIPLFWYCSLCTAGSGCRF